MTETTTSFAGSIASQIVDAFQTLLSGGAQGIIDLFNQVFVAENGSITLFGSWILAFIGVGAALGVIRALRKKASV